MTTAAVVGGTGLVGSHILSLLLNHPAISSVTALARRTPKTEDPSHKLNALVESDTTKWASNLGSVQPAPQIFFSGLGTTKAQAKSFENQYKIDHDLNLELAKAAQEAGAQIYVLISAAAVSVNSNFAYGRMKAELEEGVKKLDFKHVVLVKPGMIVGPRDDARLAEAALRGIANCVGKISESALKDWWAQDADVIAKAAVNAGLKCLNGQAPAGKVWALHAADIIRLGRKEWEM